ncbi:hypothetical protein ACP70R_011478 [Stipagrostis hirtigluma subsp. patula]
MAARMSWADLNPELLSCVAERLHELTWLVAARGVCTAWRLALPPASPLLLLVPKDDGYGYGYGAPCASAFSVPLRRVFRLSTLPAGASRCLGSSGGWLAVVACPAAAPLGTRRVYWNLAASPTMMSASASRIVLFNTLTGKQVVLPQHTWLDPASVSRIAFAANPTDDDFTVVAACGLTDGNMTLVYIRATDHATWSAFEEIARYTVPVLADLVYHDAGGGGGGGKVYCLGMDGSVHILHVPGGRTVTARPVLEPLLADQHAGAGFFNPADFFAPPYDKLSKILSSEKSLAFFDGRLHQIWRNTIGCSFRVRLPDGGWFSVSKNEVLVLRHDPARRPCRWEAVPDLGGRSAFVGGRVSTMVSARGEGMPWLKVNGDCVYWVSRFGSGPVMAFDMETRRCTMVGLPPPAAGGMPVGWFSLEGGMTRSNDNDGEILQPQQEPTRYRTKARARGVRARIPGHETTTATPVCRTARLPWRSRRGEALAAAALPGRSRGAVRTRTAAAVAAGLTQQANRRRAAATPRRGEGTGKEARGMDGGAGRAGRRRLPR